MRKKFIGSLLVLGVSVVVALLLGEILLRVYYFASDRVLGKDEEEKCTKKAYERVMNSSHEHRFDPGETNYLEYWNYSGVRPKANLQDDQVLQKKVDECKTLYRVYYNVHTNDQHLRALQHYEVQKPAGVRRIAVFGDSFTWGTNVFLLQSFPALLEHFSGAEVLNFGIEGVSLQEMYLRWKFEGKEYGPDAVVFVVYSDDIRRMQPCVYKPRLSVENGKVVIENMPPPRLEEVQTLYHPPLFESYLLKHLLYVLKYRGSVAQVQEQEGLEVAGAIFREVQETSTATGVKFLVVVIEGDQGHPELLKHVLDTEQVMWISAHDLFVQEGYDPDEYYNLSSDHFSPTGYAILAQGVKRKLVEMGVLPDSPEYRFQWNSKDTFFLVENKADPHDKGMILPFEDFEADRCKGTTEMVPVQI